tara:strand:+ start:1653 stop:2849 length:1197 start_codon:yes stop_codon:yes gene_type:complete
MNAFYFIFSRFKKLKSKKGFLVFNFYLSLSLITLSLVAIILTDSFTQGYKDEIFLKLSALNPDFKIKKKNQENFSFEDYNLIQQRLSNNDYEIIYTPYIEKKAIIFTNNAYSNDSYEQYKQREGVYVIGVKENFFSDKNLINKYFQHKEFIFNSNSIVIGYYLAQKINKNINDEIDLLVFDESSKSFINKRFIIKNIYKTQTQNDEFLIYAPINTLNEFGDNFYCNGFIGYFIDKSQNNFIKLNDSSLLIETWDSNNILIFLNSFDAPLKLLMWILMFLSVYSLSSLIFNLLIDKKDDLKILYLMGYSVNSLRYIILSISLYISMISVFVGVLISILCIFFQNNFQIISLPSEKIFQLTFLPAHFNIVYFIKYPIFLLLFTVFISWYVFNKNFKIHLK